MQKLITAALATAFATASSLAVLAGGTQAPVPGHQGFLSSAPTIALADENENDEVENGEVENEGNQGQQYNQGTFNPQNVAENDEHGGEGHHGNRGNSEGAHDCANPAGHEKGWCKHNGEHEHEGRNNHGSMRVSGTVQSINGTTIYFLRDNGQPITFIDNNGTQLSVHEHLTVRLYNVNGQYALAPQNGGYNGQNNQQISGTILLVSGSTLTLINGTVIDISQAQQRGAVYGTLSIGRSIVADGYRGNDNVFHATSVQVR